MNHSTSSDADQLQNGELNWPEVPICRFSIYGDAYVLRKKGSGGGIAGGQAQHIVSKLKCKLWSCPACRVVKSKAWRMRLRAYLATAFAEGRVPFIITQVDKSEWNTINRRLSRADARYCMVDTDANRLVIGAAVAGQVPKGAHEIDEELAYALLDKHILDISGRSYNKNLIKKGSANRPISACRAWKAPPEEREYEMVGRAPTRDPIELKTLLGNNQIIAKTFEKDGGWLMRFRATPDQLSSVFYNTGVREVREESTARDNSAKSALKSAKEESKEVEKAFEGPSSSEGGCPIPMATCPRDSQLPLRWHPDVLALASRLPPVEST